MDFREYDSNYLAHHGVMGMHWGIRRYQPYREGDGQAGKGKEVGQASKRKANIAKGSMNRNAASETGKDRSYNAKNFAKNMAVGTAVVSAALLSTNPATRVLVKNGAAKAASVMKTTGTKQVSAIKKKGKQMAFDSKFMAYSVGQDARTAADMARRKYQPGIKRTGARLQLAGSKAKSAGETARLKGMYGVDAVKNTRVGQRVKSAGETARIKGMYGADAVKRAGSVAKGGAQYDYNHVIKPGAQRIASKAKSAGSVAKGAATYDYNHVIKPGAQRVASAGRNATKRVGDAGRTIANTTPKQAAQATAQKAKHAKRSVELNAVYGADAAKKAGQKAYYNAYRVGGNVPAYASEFGGRVGQKTVQIGERRTEKSALRAANKKVKGNPYQPTYEKRKRR